MNSNLAELFVSMRDFNQGASEDAIATLLDELAVQLPSEYLDLLRWHDGMEGPLGTKGYLALWSSQEVAQFSKEFPNEEYGPGLVRIGGDGGGMGYGIDARSGDTKTMSYVEYDLISLGWHELWFQSNDLETFLIHVAED